MYIWLFFIVILDFPLILVTFAKYKYSNHHLKYHKLHILNRESTIQISSSEIKYVTIVGLIGNILKAQLITNSLADQNGIDLLK